MAEMLPFQIRLYENPPPDTFVPSDTWASAREGIDLIASLVGVSLSGGASITRKGKQNALRHISGHGRGLAQTRSDMDPGHRVLVSTRRLDAE